ncbi:MAG: zinc ribbon domain-containing protein [Acidobacteria bacterium]|nr:zinc ribbon domain-containing protein [Acidobacteriota bacterium]
MPIYEYVCNDCQTPYEKLVMSSKSPIACPKCGSKKHTQQFSKFSTTNSSSSSASSGDSSPSSSGGPCCNPGGCGCH